MQIIDQIKSVAIQGVTKTIAIDGEGRFGLARELAPGALDFVSPPAGIGDVIAAARAIVAGNARAVTQPGVTLGLSVGVIAATWKLGNVVDGLEAALEENAKLRSLCLEAKLALFTVDGEAELYERLNEATKGEA